MKRNVLSCTALLTALVAYGCSEDRPSPTEMTELQAAFGKSGGSGGGTTVTDPVSTFHIPTSPSGLGLWGDGKTPRTSSFGGVSVQVSVYEHLKCGVETRFFLTGSGDAILNSAGDSRSASKCSDAPRKVNIDFSSPVESSTLKGGPVSVTVFMNTLGVQNASSRITIGHTELRDLNIGLSANPYCDALRFRETLPAQNNIPTGADKVNVTRLSANAWRVHSQSGLTKAACLKNDVLVGRYEIPVDFYITTDRDLP